MTSLINIISSVLILILFKLGVLNTYLCCKTFYIMFNLLMIILHIINQIILLIDTFPNYLLIWYLSLLLLSLNIKAISISIWKNLIGMFLCFSHSLPLLTNSLHDLFCGPCRMLPLQYFPLLNKTNLITMNTSYE